MPKLSVALPVYNEETVLEKNVTVIGEFLSQRFGSDFEIVIVDNGSTDRTLALAVNLSKSHDYLRIMHLEEKGRGRALRSAWSASESEIVSYMDIDLATDLASFPDMVLAVESGSDIAIGSRWVPGADVQRSYVRAVLSGGYNLLLKMVLGVRFSDAQCGFKALKKKVLEDLAPDLKNDEWFFDTELLFKASRKGFTIKEIPVRWDEHRDRKSKVNVFGTVLDYLVLVFKLRLE